ncbi:hypothetical protein KEJ15_09495 [Candidatus Bathyarchaeota archaeon]|nr:hypothetical protein [Candidatus Bathyarchaeota archaeon]
MRLGAEQRLPPYAWQIRIADYLRLLQKMKSIFERRLAKSKHHSYLGKVNFNFRRFKAQVSIENGEIADIRQLNVDEPCVIGLNPPASTQLLLGYRSREELEACFPDFWVKPEFRGLIDILFPKTPSFIHAAY